MRRRWPGVSAGLSLRGPPGARRATRPQEPADQPCSSSAEGPGRAYPGPSSPPKSLLTVCPRRRWHLSTYGRPRQRNHDQQDAADQEDNAAAEQAGRHQPDRAEHEHRARDRRDDPAARPSARPLRGCLPQVRGLGQVLGPIRVAAGSGSAYIDIDAHYGDGVQAAFWADPRVLRAVAECPAPGSWWEESASEDGFLFQKWGGPASKRPDPDAPWRSFSRQFDSATARLTISVHQHPATLFPFTGLPVQTGGPGAEESAVKVALPARSSDAAWLRAFHAVVSPLLWRFRPQILVSQHGATPTGEIRRPTASPAPHGNGGPEASNTHSPLSRSRG